MRKGGVVVVIIILSYGWKNRKNRKCGGGWNVIFPVYAIAGVFLIVL